MTDKPTILITGATGNIGGGAAVALAKRRAGVVLLGRKLERLEARADSIRVALSEAQIDYQDTDLATLVIDCLGLQARSSHLLRKHKRPLGRLRFAGIGGA